MSRAAALLRAALLLAVALPAGTVLAGTARAGETQGGVVQTETGPAASAAPSSRICTDAQPCLTLQDGSATLVIDTGKARHRVPLPDLPPLDFADTLPEIAAPDLWSATAPNPDGSRLIGLTQAGSTMYSGGGGMAVRLTLLRVPPDSPAQIVLDLPVWSQITIRACFSEADMLLREGACHDSYDFTASLVPSGDGPMPDLLYQSEAWAFPPDASRYEDTSARPLPEEGRTAGDAGPAPVPRCSVTRRFVWDGVSYRPDAPLPDCNDFTDP